ncbi:MAG TPA: hypothetical protein VEC38_03235 [Candidatus Binataceae bacterium]|nr:hypothetical protein [Candidatus Binataceae bacterium]
MDNISQIQPYRRDDARRIKRVFSGLKARAFLPIESAGAKIPNCENDLASEGPHRASAPGDCFARSRKAQI